MTTPADTFRRAVLGMPYDPAKQPERVLSVQGIDELWANVEAVTAGALAYGNLSGLQATSTAAVGLMAWVVGDSTAASNGIYANTGSPTAAVWTRKGDLPVGVITLVDAGAGTPNAVQLTASLPIPASKRVILISNIADANTGNVTLAVNGGAPRALLTASGAQIPAGGLAAGSMIIFVDGAANYRLLSDVASAAIQAAAEAAQAAAEAARDIAAGYASSAVAQGNVPLYATLSGMSAITVPVGLLSFEVAGYAAVGDGGRSHYARVATQPAHAGKVRTADRFLPNGSTDSGNGGWWELREERVTLPMFGYGGGDIAASLAAALTYTGDIDLFGAMELASASGLDNSLGGLTRAHFRAAIGTTLTYTGAAVAYALQFYQMDDFRIEGDLTIDCASKAAIGLEVYLLDVGSADVTGVQVLNAYLSTPLSGGDASGIQIIGPTGTAGVARRISVRGCKVDGVSRNVSGGFSSGISITAALLMEVSRNAINHVSKGNGTSDADAIKVFSQFNAGTGTYQRATASVQGNDIRNWEGRAVKTQVAGLLESSGNYMAIDEVIAPQDDWHVTDHQALNVSEHDNTIDLLATPSNSTIDSVMFGAAPADVPEFPANPQVISYRGNKIKVANAFAQALSANGFQRLFLMTADTSKYDLGTKAARIEYEAIDNTIVTDQNFGSAVAGDIAFDVRVPVSWASGGQVRVRLKGNVVEANHWLLSLAASGGTAAHGGLGDLTGLLSYDIKGNKLPKAATVPVMPYTSNQCFTSSISVAGNQIGLSADEWDAPFDFAKILGGCDFYLPASTTPAHANHPTNYTASLVARRGRYLEVKYAGDNPANLSISLTNVGATPSWLP